MAKEFILDNSQEGEILLGKELNLEETAEVLDLLRKVKGLSLDFHRDVNFKGSKKQELMKLIQRTYIDYLSRNTDIPKKSIERVNDSGIHLYSRFEGYPLDVIYSFSRDMSSSDMINTNFRLGCARINRGMSASIVSFEGSLFGGRNDKYTCQLKNIAKGMRIHREDESDIELAEKYQSRLYNLLEEKLQIPKFVDMGD